MPKASNSRIPPAYDGCKTPPKRANIAETDSALGGSRASSSTEVPASERRGVFPFSWGWQLAGLIAAVITGLLLVVGYFHCQAPPYMLLAGLGILGLSVYSAVRTNWLREVAAKPLPVKIGAGTAVICGLVPIGIALLSAAIAGGIFAIIFGALVALGGE
jgi:hypothetical protein